MRGKNLSRCLILGTVIGSLSHTPALASTVSPSELYVYDPAKVQMVDGTDGNSSVSLRFWLSTPSRAAYDFGFMDDGMYVSMTGASRTQGRHTFLGGDIVDFALRNYGNDGTFGTSDDLVYRISDAAGYAQQHYFAPINPSRSRNPVVTSTYYQDLGLSWDLDLDGHFTAHTLIEFISSKYDGMRPAPNTPVYCPTPTETPTPVPAPAALWLFGSGLLALATAFRRRESPA